MRSVELNPMDSDTLHGEEKLHDTEKSNMEKSGEETQKLQRTLKSRHLSMISIGGTIGTGLFLACGSSIANAGPGGSLVSYFAIGIMVFLLMTSLGEMATYMPVSGSFNTYGSRFVDSAFGFALGWNYWFNWAITVAVELVAGGIIVEYWLPNVPKIVWSIILLIIIVGLNCISVKGYGEAEYWFALIKIITVVIFIIIGIVVAAGGLGHHTYGFENWTIPEAPFVNGALGVFKVFLVAGFSFQGTEMVGVAAGESSNPEKHVPKAIKQVFWRILLFYICAIFIIGLLIPWNDPRLLDAGDGTSNSVSISPFTLVFQKAGLGPAPDIMNAIILITVLSAGNSGMYASTRTLWVLANEGKAPKFLRKVNSRGIPIYCLAATTLVACVAFASNFLKGGVVYEWLLNISGVCGFLAWFGIALSHYRFRKAFLIQGHDMKELPYSAMFYPFGPLLALFLCTVVIIGQGYVGFASHPIDWSSIISNYLAVFLFLILFLGYKIVKKTKLVRLEDCDFSME
ncbi:lysine-specific permease [Basidiobolus meristosporus CBS 931.73]|uniref:Lysine-specific permease n=1 Tax=Basidiobolus meristosporus CBS 931.73 TaxID=1314790 RepID=A0A1Y1Y909_9FUNG|nr:lysine-specific permease [Basidiobolus meristosporus CBS 931.73]|eukprot:ORX94510.1 lysine-specific permease [Basidiobolus meristosporus CBS 931.73]